MEGFCSYTKMRKGAQVKLGTLLQKKTQKHIIMITLTVKSYAKKQRILIYYESLFCFFFCFFFFSRINVHDTCNLWQIKLRLEKKLLVSRSYYFLFWLKVLCCCCCFQARTDSPNGDFGAISVTERRKVFHAIQKVDRHISDTEVFVTLRRGGEGE